MELIYLFKILLRNRKIIFGSAIICALLAFVISLTINNKYKSQAQIATGYTIRQDIELANADFNMGEIEMKFNNVIENMTSSKVLNLLSYQLMIHDLTSPIPFTKVNQDDWTKIDELAGLTPEEASVRLKNKLDSMLLLRPSVESDKQLLDLMGLYKYDPETIKKGLDIYRFQKSDYINITFLSENPELSEFVVNTLVKEFQRYFEVNRRMRSAESMIMIDSMIKVRKTDLDRKINAKTAFLRDSIKKTSGQNYLPNKIEMVSSYENNLAEETSRIKSLEFKLSQINTQLQSLGVETDRTTSLNSNNQEYTTLRRQYNDLYDMYIKAGSNDPAMKQRLADIQTKMRLAAEGSSIVENNSSSNSNSQVNALNKTKLDIEGDLQSAYSKVEFYKTKLNEVRKYIGSISSTSSARFDQLNKDIELATIEYTNAKSKIGIVSNVGESSLTNFKQTIFGQPALEPESSKKSLIIVLSFFGGLFLSSFVFLLIAYFDQTIKTPLQFQRQTGLMLLGTINHINLSATSLKEQITQIEMENSKRNNNFRELMRKLRYEIEHSGKKIIMLTSTEPQQGKTTLLQCIAFSLSLSKKKVLLIDTNFCNNDLTVHNSAMPTLEQFNLKNNEFSARDLKLLISKTGVKGVDIIGCTGGDYTPTEILPTDHLLKHLDKFSDTYDYIFIEGAPLNWYTDAKELSQYVDGIIAVFSAKSIIKPTDKESIKYFRTIPDKFIGAILNQINEVDFKS